MSKIWFYLMVCSAFLLSLTNVENLLPTMLKTSTGVINLMLEFCAIYAVWLGLIEILEKSGLNEKLSKLLSPIIKKLFKTENKEAIKQISVSLSANMLGLGNAATPSAIKAMELLDDKSSKLNYPMLMLTIFSTCSIQLIPTTIISLRQQAGSTNAYDIILPILISSALSTTFAVFCVILYEKVKKNLKKHFFTSKRKKSKTQIGKLKKNKLKKRVV